VVAARRSSAQAPDAGGADLLSLFTTMRDETSGQPLPDELLVDYVLNFIIAGRWARARGLLTASLWLLVCWATVATHALHWAALGSAARWLLAATSCCSTACLRPSPLTPPPDTHPAAPFLAKLTQPAAATGRDTTANALAWTLHELSQNPGEEQALLQEVVRVMTASASATPAKAGSHPATTTHATADTAHDTSSQRDQSHSKTQTQDQDQDHGQGQGQQQQQQQAESAPSSLPSSLPSYDDIHAMRFSRAVLLEALRLHPSVPKQVKFAVADDVLPDSGTHVPGGSAIMYSSYIMGRSESIWGPDAGQFRPSRWLSGEPGSLPSAFEYPVFNAGPRICLGKGLAELEGVYVLVGLLQRYRLEVVAGQEVQYMTTVTLPMKEGLKVRVTRRV
jgi:cytochrome P450